MEYLNLAMRWLHIIPAIALIGGTIFMRVAVVPACNQLDEEVRKSVQKTVRRYWLRLLMPSALLLLLSGVFNTANISMNYQFPGGYYMPLLGLKLFLAIAIIFLASLLAGRSESAAKFRQREQFWLNINILLAVLLVCIAGAMRLAPRELKEKQPVEKQSTAAHTSWQSGDSSILGKR